MNNLVARILTRLDKTVEHFGNYAIEDRGLYQTMNIEDFLLELKLMSSEQAGFCLIELLNAKPGKASKQKRKDLVEWILCELEDFENIQSIVQTNPRLKTLFL